MLRYKLYIFSLASYILFNWGSVALANDEIEANIQPLFDACINRCERTDILGNLTREGCFKGCEQIRRTFPLTEKTYPSPASCLKDIKEIDLNRDILIEENQAWCVKNYDHIHKRKGCKDAIEVYINAISYENVCTPKKLSAIEMATSSSLPLPLPTQKIAIAENTERNTTSNARVTPKATIKTSHNIVQPVVTKKIQTKSSAIKTASSSLKAGNNKTPLGPSISPLSLNKKMTSPVTPQKEGSISQNSPLNTKEQREKDTLNRNNKSSLPSSSLITTKKEVKKSTDATIPIARTVSMRDAMPAKETKNNIGQQEKIASQKTQKENKKRLSQEPLKSNQEKSIERETIYSLSNTNNTPKQAITPEVDQQQTSIQTQDSSIASRDTASALIMPLEEHKESSTSVATNKNLLPIQKTANKEIELTTDKKSIAQNATIAAQSISMESSNSNDPIANVITSTRMTNATEPVTPELPPELEQLVNDVHAEIDSTEDTSSSLHKDTIDTATRLSSTISSPVPSFLGVSGASKGSFDESVLQPQTNSTTTVDNQRRDSSQSSQNSIAPSIQLLQGLRKKPETASQPYGLALPASAVKAPPPPIP